MELILEKPKSIFWIVVVNTLTASRLVIAYIIGETVYYQPVFDLTMFGLVLGGGLTDLFDGILAKVCNARTRLGALFDKGADKIFVTTVNFSLYFCTPFTSSLDAYLTIFLVVVLVLEELTLSFFGIFFAAKYKTRREANRWGKAKMDVEVFAAGYWALALAAPSIGNQFLLLFFYIECINVFLLASILLAGKSGWDYLCDYRNRKKSP
ncbi:MAG: CDP-alcohol phosphatidyltransferase family protein [bacterium]